MSKKNKSGAKGKVSRKEITLALFAKLDTALKDYPLMIGEKKYVNHLMKTAKIFAGDITEASKKMKERLEKEAKKNEKKKKAGKMSDNEILNDNNVKKRKAKEPLTEVSSPDQDTTDDEED